MIHIDNETYAINDNNQNKTQTTKKQIVLATSLRKDNNHIIRLLHKELGKTKKWNTFTISREGDIYQHFNTEYYSDFIGIKEIDKQIISIVLENMGSLFKTPDENYINWLNEKCDIKNVVNKNWLGYNYWEQYYNKQIESTVLLCRKMCEKHNIPKICIDFYHYHKDINKFNGIVFRSNYIENSSDINPLFNISKFNEMLRNEFI